MAKLDRSEDRLANDSSSTDQVSLEEGSSAANKPIYLKDYQPSAFLIEKTHLDFQLLDEHTIVSCRTRIIRNHLSAQYGGLKKDSGSEKGAAQVAQDLVLVGKDLELISVFLDGELLEEQRHYAVSEDELSIKRVPDAFDLEIKVKIDPDNNLSLEGLYRSEGMYCTQCEAEGFRRITYYLDRPDVMSKFTTRIEAEKSRYPVLLSNGNKIDAGEADNGRHWSLWEDPFQKPCYLFALVAGDLSVLKDSYQTSSGRDVVLEIYAEEKDLDKCHHAMLSLKNAMRWDEEVYGREYDLDLYMIVAVSFFNMGAMENKGLNIFNTSCVLAHAKTQTDTAFQRVEAVVAHEYFHNWSGNRVTCRDWFQLSLKEGFTVFRDACFSADMHSYTVKRIEDVNLLRSAQFAEDASPMAHPIRPESYEEISNFYTLTIYEKGAEIIRMQHALLGAEAFRAGTDLYFDRHDGQAVTCEDFVCALEDASAVDLVQFRRWYSQAGTPAVQCESQWDEDESAITLTFEQFSKPSPGQPDKQDYHIPIAIGFVESGAYRHDLERVLDLKEKRQSWTFAGFKDRPIPSLLRGFSAPIKLTFDYQYADLLQLIRCEPDGYSRWDASQRYFTKIIQDQLATGFFEIDSSVAGRLAEISGVFKGLLELGCVYSSGSNTKIWDSNIIDAAMVAELVALPNMASLIEQLQPVDIQALKQVVEPIRYALAEAIEQPAREIMHCIQAQLSLAGGYEPTPTAMALRRLKNCLLEYLVLLGGDSDILFATKMFAESDNMTDQLASLDSIVLSPHPAAKVRAEQLLSEFYSQWKNEQLVINQWLSLQASIDHDGVFDRISNLAQDPVYDSSNPNNIRSLFGAFAGRNPAQFHRHDGAGYRLLADEVVRVDAFNPQIAARLVAPLTRFAQFTSSYQEQMLTTLRWIADQELSSDLQEVVSKSLL